MPDDRRGGAAAWMLALLAGGIAVRLWRYALHWPFWGDESFLNVSVLHRGFAELLAPLEYSQVAPPGFLWLQKLALLILGGGEYALRAVPLAAGVASLLLLARTAGRCLSPWGATLATGWMAASYYLVRHACESKPYSTDLLCATLLLAVGIACLHRPASVKHAAVAALTAPLAMWLSLPAMFVAGGVATAMLVTALRLPAAEGRRVALLNWSVHAGTVGVAFIALYVLVLHAHGRALGDTWLTEYWRDSFPPSGVGPLFAWLADVHTGLMFAYPVGGPRYASTLITVLVLAGVAALLRRGAPLLALMLLTPFALALVAAALQRYPYGGSVRVTIWAAPAICLLAGCGVDALARLATRAWRTRLRAGVCAALLLLLAGTAVRDTLRPYKDHGDPAIRAAAVAMAADLRPGERLMAFNPRSGLHGPPDGPALHQSLRYYIEWRTGRALLWRLEDQPSHFERLVVYRGRDHGPTEAYVAMWLAERDLVIESSATYPILGPVEALVVYTVAPAP